MTSRLSDEQRGVLEEGLTMYFGHAVPIVQIEGESLATSTHPIDRLLVTLASGERLGVIFKRLNPGHHLYGNEREVLIYRRLLKGQRFGAPALYASVQDEAQGRYWLFLEDVGEESLQHADIDAWMAAMQWLAQMHATYQGYEDDLSALGCLMEHNAAYYQLAAETARQHLVAVGAQQALARFDRLMHQFDATVAYLVRQPRTLVHGDIFPQQIMIQPGLRIRPIDWESAAIGLAAWDLARLLDGWEAEKPAFIQAYLTEFTHHAPVPMEAEIFKRTLTHTEILNVLWHLNASIEAYDDIPLADRLLNQMERVWRRLEGEAIDA